MAYTNIDKSSLHFNTKLYTGTGSSNALTGVGFQPDFTWIKRRDATSSHQLFDAVRGVTKRVFSDTNEAESTSATTLTSFDTDGFTVSTHTGLNASSGTYASWNWKANGQGSANSDGTITTTYTSANTTSGFSIVQYTGDGGASSSFGHGLGVKPDVVIYKQTSGTENWLVTTDVIDGSHDYAYLDITTGFNGAGSALPTSSVVNLTASGLYNNNGSTYIAYCFAPIKGFSKFGAYTGNGSTDGVFIYTGFKPAFLILRRTNAENWIMLGNKRNAYNVVNNLILPNQNIAEFASDYVDFVSNGFKLRTSATGANANGGITFYMCFAEAPLVGSNNVPCTAR